MNPRDLSLAFFALTLYPQTALAMGGEGFAAGLLQLLLYVYLFSIVVGIFSFAVVRQHETSVVAPTLANAARLSVVICFAAIVKFEEFGIFIAVILFIPLLALCFATVATFDVLAKTIKNCLAKAKRRNAESKPVEPLGIYAANGELLSHEAAIETIGQFNRAQCDKLLCRYGAPIGGRYESIDNMRIRCTNVISLVTNNHLV